MNDRTDWKAAFERELAARLALARRYEALRRECDRAQASVEMARRVGT